MILIIKIIKKTSMTAIIAVPVTFTEMMIYMNKSRAFIFSIIINHIDYSCYI